MLKLSGIKISESGESPKIKYIFSARNWTKIWFTQNPNIFTLPENKIHIIYFLNQFTHRTLSIIYDSRLFNDNGKQDLLRTQNELNNKYQDRIQFIDFSSQEFKAQLANNMVEGIFSIFGYLSFKFLTRKI